MIYQGATGSGKTALAAAIAEGLDARGKSLLALVHRHELVDQFTRTLDLVGLTGRYGVIAAGRAPSPWARFQVASIPTLHRRPHLDLDPDYVVVDEAHHARAKTWSEVIARFPRARILGLTATPARLDGKPLGAHFEALVQGPSIQWLVAHGRLAPVTMKYVGRGVLTQGVKKSGGDYNRRDLGDRLNKSVIAAPVAAYLRHARDRQAIFFAINTQDSRAVRDLFVENGVRAVHVDGKTPTGIRDNLIGEFRHGHAQVLCNVDIVSEGTDIPECSCVMMGCPTLSLVRYLQWVGRGMRVDHGRDCMALDLVGNFWRHGAPDKPRIWSLHTEEPEAKKKREQAVSMRVCVHCANVYPARSGECPACGQEQPMEIPKHLDVELLTRDGDEPVEPRSTDVMKEVRRELRALARNKTMCRSSVQDLRARFDLSPRWEQNALEALGL